MDKRCCISYKYSYYLFVTSARPCDPDLHGAYVHILADHDISKYWKNDMIQIIVHACTVIL